MNLNKIYILCYALLMIKFVHASNQKESLNHLKDYTSIDIFDDGSIITAYTNYTTYLTTYTVYSNGNWIARTELDGCDNYVITTYDAQTKLITSDDSNKQTYTPKSKKQKVDN